MKRIIIIAGPNGAGKTTCAKEYLLREGRCPNFIHADLIAAGLAPFNPAGAAVHAGRLMILEMQRYLRRGESFAFETTLSGRSYARQVPSWQAAGLGILFWISVMIRTGKKFGGFACVFIGLATLYGPLAGAILRGVGE